MTGERLEVVSVGSCSSCGGPVRFLDARDDPTALYETTERHIRLPNIDEDLGGGWVLDWLGRSWIAPTADHRYMARATRPAGTWPTTLLVELAHGHGDSPSAAYLALRTAIEARA